MTPESMLIHEFQATGRTLKQENLTADLVVVGGGMAGVCGSITAARQGLRVILVQDRPVLGGNASSEVRLWNLGATSHMGNNNRWAREGGVVNEILVENIWRNPEGNAVLFDPLLLEFVTREPNITLLLNTAAHSIEKNADGSIAKVNAFCSQNSVSYTLSAPLFCDASGDGILGFLSGAAFRVGAEAASEFGEGMAGPEPVHELLGHSLYFYSRDTGRPVTYVPPAFALKDIKEIPRYKDLHSTDSGCVLWWLEWGGDLDTVHDTERIKWELWRVAYGVWDYIKNSGTFPNVANLTLEWVGMIPGKRESRRFEGDYILRQQEIVEQRSHFDAVSYGGWAIDLHPAKGVYSSAPSCTQWHAKGVYQIPYRIMYSRNIPNLFIAGRIVSSTHVAFGSTRVMLTCSNGAQAVGMAAAMCTEKHLLPRDITDSKRMVELQQRLLRTGQFIPNVPWNDSSELARKAHLSASSTLTIDKFKPSGEVHSDDSPCALLLPLNAGPVPDVEILVDADADATLKMEVWGSSRIGNTTPDVKIAEASVPVAAGKPRTAKFHFDASIDKPAHIFFMIFPVAGVSLHLSKDQYPGVLTLWRRMNKRVAKAVDQTPPPGSGLETFSFWLPQRRPEARNIAATITPPIRSYEPEMAVNQWGRPWCGANAWAPANDDKEPSLHLAWDQPQTIKTIQLTFDTDYDHPMESALMGHPERIMPGCITAFRVSTKEGKELAAVAENHQPYWRLTLPEPLTTTGLDIAILGHGSAPPALFEVRCF